MNGDVYKTLTAKEKLMYDELMAAVKTLAQRSDGITELLNKLLKLVEEP